MKRFYVAWSSWFDTHEYNNEKIAEAVKESGGVRVMSAHAFGWSNQPKVVTFSANNDDLSAIKEAVGEATNTVWIIIQEKNW